MSQSRLTLGIQLVVGVAIGVFIANWARGPVQGVLEKVGGTSLVSKVVQADRGLDSQVTDLVGATPTPEPEIDFEHPTERDFQFLVRLLREGPEPARGSAMRALVSLGDVRAVPILLTLPASDAHRATFCLAALEIIRFQGRDVASRTLAESLSAPTDSLLPQCRSDVLDVWKRILGTDPALWLDLLSAGGAVTGLALQHLPLEPDPSWIARVRTLAAVGEAGVRDGARAWLTRVAPEALQEEAPAPPGGAEP